VIVSRQSGQDLRANSLSLSALDVVLVESFRHAATHWQTIRCYT